MRVQSGDRLSNSGFHRAGGKGSGKACWWLKGPSGFVDLPERARGDEYFDMELDLEPGSYTLGVGSGRDAIREDFTVERPAEDADEQAEG